MFKGNYKKIFLSLLLLLMVFSPLGQLSKKVYGQETFPSTESTEFIFLGEDGEEIKIQVDDTQIVPPGPDAPLLESDPAYRVYPIGEDDNRIDISTSQDSSSPNSSTNPEEITDSTEEEPNSTETNPLYEGVSENDMYNTGDPTSSSEPENTAEYYNYEPQNTTDGDSEFPYPYPIQDRKDALDQSEVTDRYVDPGVGGGSGKFLWKPISESDGKLVILFDAPGDVHIFIPDANGKLSYYETCRSDSRAGTNNGYLNGARCSKPGAEYPRGTVVKIGMTEIPIPNPSARLQRNVKFASVSVNDFLREEGDEDYDMFDALLSLGGAAVGCAMENILSDILVGGLMKLSSELGALSPSFAVPVRDVGRQAQEEGVMMLPGLDSIAYCLLNSLIIGLSDATIEWINSGFEGNPVFVDDPSKFFQDVADRELSIFLTNLGDGILCKEFDYDLKLAIINQHTRRPGGWCTLDRAKANMEKVFSGEEFSFEVYDQMIDNPSNTPIGAFLVLDGQMRANIYEETAELSKELEWGNGYFSWKTCETPEGGGEEICKTVTPGHVVQGKTLGRLGLAEDRLVLADEFNEILTALVNQLIKIGAQEILGA